MELFGPHFYGFCTGFRLGSVSLGARILDTVVYSTRQLLT
jgi:hypothetical protein